ncbi:MAG: hypothetical protein CO030_02865 [Candidatus Magasanikbacteria bacterium CG_4_9_14_0_2_um_filter_42_11]|uniref:riboflavin kinase n=1 Tax=Candidatus Magasanikbacteria bacterium CG_4_9_14_0_2_um_filter_42_11 TaxID=1974643 RepID=A0A2M8F9R5_9BACT|nr:MAG: hypothetical protein COU34_02365 [Candidatus Magasanikbacteria bacterium CG10_big_fil_rev_8_21_14_0_10_43_9]PIY92855.1 MAG: hypothetical protein COY70_01075 [Candidatus Magasanikbacteria bacterium CG_4_10_14_0_8_um_filter_42_12]PJC52446.1 MAG: hypothetical protein CO030_02865 [Candidatus Magasanikbacteria bacterium CG_4_9_14_0_2_um_filter_42_11]
MLGGKIIRGDGIGRTLGYPTANINIDPEKVHFDAGVYAARATLLGTVYKAALVIMQHPWKVEAHLLDYTGDDIYGQDIQFEPVQRVSTLERYDTMDELKRKIAKDIALVREVFEDQIENIDRDDHAI